jgi:hypothetical protein
MEVTPAIAREQSRREGKRLRDATLTAIERARRDLVQRCQAAFLRRLFSGSAKAEDLRLDVELPADADPRLLGAAVLGLRRAGLIAYAGWDESDQPQSHSCPKRLWCLVDRDAADVWLRQHDCRPAGQQLALFEEGADGSAEF